MTTHDSQSPTRHPIDWENPDFYDEEKLDAEMRRVLDICHGCRRCFNLCDSFPRLFDLVDESQTGELDSVESKDFKPIVDACTLCDMCFVNKCPYVPPHEFDVDFPHLMLRYRAVDLKKNGLSFTQKQIPQMDRNAKIATKIAPIVNTLTDEKNALSRKIIEKTAGIHEKAYIPKFERESYIKKASKESYPLNTEAPGFGEKVVLYVTCFGNYHQSSIADAAHKILKHNGVEVEIFYPGCCGMPLLEQGNLEKVARNAEKIAASFQSWIEKGYVITPVVPSCTLMLKQEWPLLLPHNKDIEKLAAATQDISDYLVNLFKTKGIAKGIEPLRGNITLQLACHARAQNKGNKAAELLRFIPDITVDVIERCSGHGGSWGMMKENFDIALKVGAPVFRQAIKNQNTYVSSECPLAGEHIRQGIDITSKEESSFTHFHPLEIFAKAFGLLDGS